MYEYNAIVLHVVDGDTLDLQIDLGLNVCVKERVRILGIDTPEVYGVKKESEEYVAGMLAKNYVIDLIEGKQVVIRTHKDKKGKYGRYLAEVYYDDRNVGQLLIQEGLAKEYI